MSDINEDEKGQPDHYIATLNQDGTTTVQDLTPETGENATPYSALQAVQSALTQEPSEFENMIKLGLADRLQNAVEKRREEVAQSIFGNKDAEEPIDDNNAEDDNEEDTGEE